MRALVLDEEFYMPEPVGKQTKYWIISYGIKYLFKKATLKGDGTEIYNDVSECIASDILELLGIDHANYYLVDTTDGKGVMTPDFLDNDIGKTNKEEFFDGVFLINKIDPNFKNGSLENTKDHQLYTVSLILESLKEYGIRKEALEMFIVDALIANRDRNPSNYGIIVNHETKSVRFAPLFDNAASLGISMVNHRLNRGVDINGNIFNRDELNRTIDEPYNKVTIERFLQYQDKYKWDKIQIDKTLNKIEEKRKELLPLLEEGKITRKEYHSELYKIGREYKKFSVFALRYDTLISYLTLNYCDEIKSIIERIELLITNENIDKILSNYKDELPIDRLVMVKELLLRRSKVITEVYNNNKEESRGPILC